MKGDGREKMSFEERALRAFPTPGHLAQIIDTTLLRPEAGESDYRGFLREARDYGFRCACLPLCHLPLARLELEGSGVRVGGVLGFPFGYTPTDVKKAEAVYALQQGAQEMDMVINITALKSRRFGVVREDIDEVVRLARLYDRGKGEGHVMVKVILETCYLTPKEMREAAMLAVEAGADFVKTSTGMGPGGARAEDVVLLRETVGGACGVKASGGIRRLSEVLEMVEAGASRIGTSSAAAIMQEYLNLYRWR